MTIFLDDGDCQLHHGDVLTVLQTLPTGIAQTCVTSPPFYGLRDYGTASWSGGDPTCDHQPPTSEIERRYVAASTLEGGRDNQRAAAASLYAGSTCGRCGARRVDEQIGLEPTIHEYVDRIVEVFAEVWRVLRPDGTLWLELGDSYASSPPGNKTVGVSAKSGLNGIASDRYRETLEAGHATKRNTVTDDLPAKNLMGVPWRVAFALQEWGWYLRSDIVWSRLRPNPMPESVTDRPTKSHSYIFLLAKQPRYYYDADAIREAHKSTRWGGPIAKNTEAWKYRNGGELVGCRERDGREFYPEAGRNARSVWTIPTQPFPEAHFATYPEELVRRCILAATSQRGECAACGSPWVRETETQYVKSPVHGAGSVVGRHYETGANNWDGAGLPRLNKEVTTTGWRASCTCNAATRSQLVLDPFCGSGTTNLVARNHGRRSIGIDLSAAYLTIAAKRLAQQSLLSGAAL